MPFKKFVQGAFFAALLGASALGFAKEPFDDALKQISQGDTAIQNVYTQHIDNRIHFWSLINQYPEFYGEGKNSISPLPFEKLRTVATKAFNYYKQYNTKYTLTENDLLTIKSALYDIHEFHAKVSKLLGVRIEELNAMKGTLGINEALIFEAVNSHLSVTLRTAYNNYHSDLAALNPHAADIFKRIVVDTEMVREIPGAANCYFDVLDICGLIAGNDGVFKSASFGF